MKNSINLNHIQKIHEQLKKQIVALRSIKEEAMQAEEKLRGMSYTDKVRHALVQTRQSLEENIRVLTIMAEAAEAALVQYKRTEEKVVDRYNLDMVYYPATKFSLSRISGLEEYRMLISF